LATDGIPGRELSAALGLARESRHPLARALAAALSDRGISPARAEHVAEAPGLGLAGYAEGRELRLGSREWCAVAGDDELGVAHGPEVILRIADGPARPFRFRDAPRADAAATIAALRTRGLRVVLLSGDRPGSVRDVAQAVGITEFRCGQKPEDKAAFIRALQDAGHRVLMVGDGLNDAPALGLAHASMAPSTAADISGTAADLVFLGGRLGAVVTALDTAVRARRLVSQNFALAALYNLIAVPVAAAGLASPLVAAVAMSASSLAVTANAMRLCMAPPGETGP
jgi:Cu2+-exporting ATPase